MHTHFWSLAIIDDQDIVGGELTIEEDIIKLFIGLHLYMLFRDGETVTLTHQFCDTGKFKGQFVRLLHSWNVKNQIIPSEFSSLLARMDINGWITQ